ncbi:MAG: hypothetical protein RLZZ537_1056 [Pseudomonadota bacterium]|jgi:lipid-binding SYLF domain-containing protein
MRIQSIIPVLLMAVCAALFSSAGYAQSKEDEERTKIQADVQKTLNRLYDTQPNSRNIISKAAGYAVFNQYGVKIAVAGGGKSTGYAFHNKSNKKTYMKMVEVQAGLGLGIKKFALIWVFDNDKAFNNFVNSGFEISGQGNLTAVSDGKGVTHAGAVSVSPGVWIYQLTEKGLSAELTVKGSKYYKDADLN